MLLACCFSTYRMYGQEHLLLITNVPTQLDPGRLFGGVHVRCMCLHPRQPTVAIVRPVSLLRTAMQGLQSTCKSCRRRFAFYIRMLEHLQNLYCLIQGKPGCLARFTGQTILLPALLRQYWIWQQEV